MHYYKIISVSTIVLSLVLGGCSGLTTRQKNTAAGATIGGVAGAVLTGGSTFGTLGGVAICANLTVFPKPIVAYF